MKAKHTEILIVGAGIAGLSCAFYLRQRGFHKICLVSRPQGGLSANVSPVVSGGLNDNYTRIVTAHGRDFAKGYWQFSHQAFCALKEFCEKEGLEFKSAKKWRLADSEHEWQEILTACKDLAEDGFAVLKSPPPPEVNSALLGVQDEGECGGIFDRDGTLRVLGKDLESVEGAVRSVSPSPNFCEVELEDGTCLRAELVVCTNHLGVRELVPFLQEVLVPVAEQQEHFSCADQPLPAGQVFFNQHGYQWGGFGKNCLYIGGARYFRPMAGIGAEECKPSSKITEVLTQKAQMLFPKIQLTHQKTVCGLSCRPCDELPVIGPLPGEERIIVASGFMTQGLSLGFYAGVCLAELIATGQCPHLPRRIWPERLRSMS